MLKPPLVLYVSMRPYTSIFSLASKRFKIFMINFGIFKLGNYIHTVIKCSYTNPRDYSKFINFISSHPNIEHIRVLEKRRRSLSFIAVKKSCRFYEKIITKEFLVLMPYVIVDGYKKFFIVVTEQSMDDVVEKLKKHGVIVHLETLPFDIAVNKLTSYINALNLHSVLTDRQLNILDMAYSCGYYEWPRRLSVTKLAKQLSLSKSAACERLRKAELKVIKYVLKEALPIIRGARVNRAEIPLKLREVA